MSMIHCAVNKHLAGTVLCHFVTLSLCRYFSEGENGATEEKEVLGLVGEKVKYLTNN